MKMGNNMAVRVGTIPLWLGHEDLCSPVGRLLEEINILLVECNDRQLRKLEYRELVLYKHFN